MRRLAVCLLAFFTTLVVVAPPSSATGPVSYVALGDSYSAASGVLPVDASVPQCLRSTRNYSHLLATTLGASLTDVTCGGADSPDLFTEQYSGVAPQLNAVRSNTQLITMTIGGNDNNVFINAITTCGALGVASAGQGSPCKDKYGASMISTVRTKTYPALVTAFKATRRKAPRAKIAALGYPWIMPKVGSCFLKMPVTPGDAPFLRKLQAELNSAVKRAAAAARITYVDFSTVSEGHTACDPIGQRWIEPVLLGTNPVVVHPNALGERRMAEQVMKVLRLG